MTFIVINLIVTACAFLLLWLNSVKAWHIFRAKYPELTIPRSHWSDRALAAIEIILTHICPIVNVAFLVIYIINSDELCEKTINKIYKRCMEE